MRTMLLLVFSASLMCVVNAQAATDTLRTDDGIASQVNVLRPMWEESVILNPNAPCLVKKVLIHYATTGTDTIRIAGDAAEGTIPPTQYCHAYNTLARVVVNVVQKGWKEVDLSSFDIQIGGYDRIVVQHVLGTGVALWSQDAGQTSVTSFLYDAVTPNPNFSNIPGIFYRANGDYLVRLLVDRETTVPPPPTWTDITETAGIVNGQGARFRSDLASVADINGDHWEDVIIGRTAYINLQGQGFERRDLGITGSNTVWGDLDGDGDLDCFSVNANGDAGRYDGIYENDGTGKLTNRTDGNGLENIAPTVTPLMFDYDHDGDLDIFIANGRKTVNNQEVYFQDRLFRNDGDFTFTDVTVASKISLGEPAPYHDTWGASLADVNMDGWTDIFVATYRLAPDRLYVNNGDGTFTERSQQTGCIGVPTAAVGYYGHGMGSDWGDIDNDGDLDLFVGNLGHPDQRGQYSNPSLVFRNNGTPTDPSFQNWHSVDANGKLTFSGVSFKEMNAGMCLGDFDHDGLLDLYHGQLSYDLYGEGATRPAHFYIQGQQRFQDRTWETGLFIHGSWTGVRFDVDRDGDLDLVAASGRHEVRLFRNDLPKRGTAVSLRLKNADVQEMPTDASGSTATVHAGGKRFVRQLPGTVTGGRCSQMSSELHFGLGAATSIDSVVVRWSNGTRRTYTSVPINTYSVLSTDGTSTSPLLGTPQQITPAIHAINVSVDPQFKIDRAGPFEIEVASDASMTDVVGRATSATGPVMIGKQLKQGATYYWRARLERGPAVGPWSSVWPFTVGKPAPKPPTITAPKQAADGIELTPIIAWSPSGFASHQTTTVSYDVEVTKEGDGQPTWSATAVTDSAVECGLLSIRTPYSVRVRAVGDWDGERVQGDWSSVVSFTTYGFVPAVQLFEPADGSVDQPVRPRLKWHGASWVDDGYEVQYDLREDFTTATTKDRPDTNLLIISALQTGRTYHWRVRGKNEAGLGAWSPTWTFTVEGTVGVDDEVIEVENGVVVAYNVLGGVVGTYSTTEWNSAAADLLHGPLFIVVFDRSGHVIQRVTHLQR
jgi:hypothetical protein